MRFFETAKLAAGIDPDKKLLGGKRPPFFMNGRPFSLCGTGNLEGESVSVCEPVCFSGFVMYRRTVSKSVTA